MTSSVEEFDHVDRLRAGGIDPLAPDVELVAYLDLGGYRHLVLALVDSCLADGGFCACGS